jgi:hypothetical protein
VVLLYYCDVFRDREVPVARVYAVLHLSRTGTGTPCCFPETTSTKSQFFQSMGPPLPIGISVCIFAHFNRDVLATVMAAFSLNLRY